MNNNITKTICSFSSSAKQSSSKIGQALLQSPSVKPLSYAYILIFFIALTLFACELPKIIEVDGENPITGTLSFSTNNNSALIDVTLENGMSVYTVTFTEGQSIALDMGWQGRQDDDQIVEYKISPQNENVLLDTINGKVTVTYTASIQDSGDYLVSATGINNYEGEASLILRIQIERALEGSFTYATNIETVENIPITSDAPLWDTEPPADIQYNFDPNPSSQHITIDKTTGIVYLSKDMVAAELADQGLYTVVATAEGYAGTASTSLTVSLVDKCDALSSGIRPVRDGAEEPFVISNWKEFLYLSLNAPSSSEEPNFKSSYVLTSDIELPHKECGINAGKPNLSFSPIGTEEQFFRGSFDGQNHTIKGLYINNTNRNFAGLFGSVSGTTAETTVVQNLKLSDVHLHAEAVLGAAVGFLDKGIINNVHATGTGNIIADWRSKIFEINNYEFAYAGGLVGASGSATTVSNSSSSLSVTGDYNTIGGLVGYAEGRVEGFSSGNVSGTSTKVGGLVGHAEADVEGYSTGAISGKESIGGLVGYAVGSVKGYSTGTVNGSQNEVGGLVGWLKGQVSGYATADITGSDKTGGIVGYLEGTAIGYSTGSIEGEDSVGGLVGYMLSDGVSKGFSIGSVTGDTYVGGLVGQSVSHDSIIGYSMGDQTGSSRVGGMVGYMFGPVTGYSRSNINSVFGSASTEFGKMTGGKIIGTHKTHISLKTGESTLYQLSATGTKDPYDEDRASITIGAGSTITDSTTALEQETVFSKLSLPSTKDTIWELSDGHWPAIRLPELADIDGAKHSALGQKEFTTP